MSLILPAMLAMAEPFLNDFQNRKFMRELTPEEKAEKEKRMLEYKWWRKSRNNPPSDRKVEKAKKRKKKRGW